MESHGYLEFCCRECKKTKALEDAVKDKTTVTGRTNWCKQCKNKKNGSYWLTSYKHLNAEEEVITRPCLGCDTIIRTNKYWRLCVPCRTYANGDSVYVDTDYNGTMNRTKGRGIGNGERE